MKTNVEEMMSLIKNVTAELGEGISNQYEIEYLNKGEKPKKLPKGKMAIYMFYYEKDKCFLKIGKANKNSNARYSSHHYNPNSSNSNLAKSIVKDDELFCDINNDNVKDFIINELTRVNILLDEDLGMFVLNLVESLFQYKFQPKYEGFESQRRI